MSNIELARNIADLQAEVYGLVESQTQSSSSYEYFGSKYYHEETYASYQPHPTYQYWSRQQSPQYDSSCEYYPPSWEYQHEMPCNSMNYEQYYPMQVEELQVDTRVSQEEDVVGTLGCSSSYSQLEIDQKFKEYYIEFARHLDSIYPEERELTQFFVQQLTETDMCVTAPDGPADVTPLPSIVEDNVAKESVDQLCSEHTEDHVNFVYHKMLEDEKSWDDKSDITNSLEGSKCGKEVEDTTIYLDHVYVDPMLPLPREPPLAEFCFGKTHSLRLVVDIELSNTYHVRLEGDNIHNPWIVDYDALHGCTPYFDGVIWSSQ